MRWENERDFWPTFGFENWVLAHFFLGQGRSNPLWPTFWPTFSGFWPTFEKKTGPNFLLILSKNGSKMVKKGVKMAYFSCFSTKIDTFWVIFEEMKIFGPLCPLFFLFNCEKKIYIFIKFLK